MKFISASSQCYTLRPPADRHANKLLPVRDAKLKFLGGAKLKSAQRRTNTT